MMNQNHAELPSAFSVPVALERDGPIERKRKRIRGQAANRSRSSKKRGVSGLFPGSCIIRVGSFQLALNQTLLPLLDSTPLLLSDAYSHLHYRLKRDGYLFLRGVLPAESVRLARQKITTHLYRKNVILGQEKDKDKALVGKDKQGNWCAGWTIDTGTGGSAHFSHQDHSTLLRLNQDKSFLSRMINVFIECIANKFCVLLLLDVQCKCWS